MKELLAPYIGHILVFVALLTVVWFSFKIWRCGQLIKNDGAYKKTDPQTGVTQEGRPRNVWDYSFFPGISRLWHTADFKTVVAFLTLMVLLFAYLYRRDAALLNLLGINLGVIIGMAIKGR